MGAMLPVDPEPCQLWLGHDHAVIAIGKAQKPPLLFIRIKRPMHFHRAGDHLGKHGAFFVSLAPDSNRLIMRCQIRRQGATFRKCQPLFRVKAGRAHFRDAKQHTIGHVLRPIRRDRVDIPHHVGKDVSSVIPAQIGRQRGAARP